MEPYYSDGQVSLYLGRFEDHIDAIGKADAVVADPPYGVTTLPWDRWVNGWPSLIAAVTRSLWCFGSMRMFLRHAPEFTAWRQSQDIVWEKHNGSGFAADRFKRVHEHALHFYRGPWSGVYHEVPRVPAVHKRGGDDFTRLQPEHTGNINGHGYHYHDDGTRLARSVMKVPRANGSTIHPTEKPVDLLTPLIEYACPPGGIVVDPFAGSASTLDAARRCGRRAVGVELHEPYAEAAAKRLSQAVMCA